MPQDTYCAGDILYERLWIAEARFSPGGGVWANVCVGLLQWERGKFRKVEYHFLILHFSLLAVLFFSLLFSTGFPLF